MCAETDASMMLNPRFAPGETQAAEEFFVVASREAIRPDLYVP